MKNYVVKNYRKSKQFNSDIILNNGAQWQSRLNVGKKSNSYMILAQIPLSPSIEVQTQTDTVFHLPSVTPVCKKIMPISSHTLLYITC